MFQAVPQPDAGPFLLTAAEHEAHARELERLRETRERLRGDGIEEAGTDLLIARWEDLLARATIVEAARATGTVRVGCDVTVVYERTGRRVTYRLTGLGRDGLGVSSRSPVGQALLGRRVAETVTVRMPDGSFEPLRIAAIDAQERAA